MLAIRQDQPLGRTGPAMKTILLVENDEAIGEVLVLVLLQEDFYSPVLATSVDEALAIVNRIPIDLFMIEYRLIGSNGFHLYDRLHAREDLQSIPVIMMSTCLEIQGQELQRRNIVGISKPFDVDELLETVKIAVG